MAVVRNDWERHVVDVVRSRHYTWLPVGLGGEPVNLAMSYLVTDIMHVCHRAGVDWNTVLAEATSRFQEEEQNSSIKSTRD